MDHGIAWGLIGGDKDFSDRPHGPSPLDALQLIVGATRSRVRRPATTIEPVASSFSNEPIDVSGIPQLRDDAFVPVHPNLLRVALIGRGIFATIVIAIGIAVTALSDMDVWIPIALSGGVLALIMLSVVLKILEIKNIAYQVREHDLSYRNGLLVKRVQTVPFVRVQHAQMRQGPVERLFGISTLGINSAGPDLAIAGLGVEDATRLRALVIERAGELIEEQ